MKRFLACCVLGSAPLADASVVRFTFTGTVTEVSSPVVVPVKVGSPFTVSYTFETTTPDVEPDPNFGTYLGALINVEGEIGSLPIAFSLGNIEVRNDSALGDVHVAETGAATSELLVHLADWESGVFQNDDLPETFEIGLFESRSIAYRKFLSATSETLITGTITGFSTGCYPDCTGDEALTIADFGCFQTAFVAGDPYADCNGVGGLTIADFGCFQTSFVKGCP